MLLKVEKYKKLLSFNSKKSGHNYLGQKTVNDRRSVNKKLYRYLDFSSLIWNVPALVINLEQDPNRRNTNIALIVYVGLNMLSYVLINSYVRPGDWMINGFFTKYYRPVFYSSFLKFLPVNKKVFNLNGKYLRSIGSWFKIIEKARKVKLIFSNGVIRLFQLKDFASYGKIMKVTKVKFAKAGDRVNLGFKSKVRGIVKNPVDHPHGGGKGKKSPPSTKYSKWAKLFYKKKTARRNK